MRLLAYDEVSLELTPRGVPAFQLGSDASLGSVLE
jgi:hypothetical protein